MHDFMKKLADPAFVATLFAGRGEVPFLAAYFGINQGLSDQTVKNNEAVKLMLQAGTDLMDTFGPDYTLRTATIFMTATDIQMLANFYPTGTDQNDVPAIDIEWGVQASQIDNLPVPQDVMKVRLQMFAEKTVTIGTLSDLMMIDSTVDLLQVMMADHSAASTLARAIDAFEMRVPVPADLPDGFNFASITLVKKT